jgi:hypothetical protein
MKVGMILECGPGGADEQIHPILARRLNQRIKISTATLGNKPKLIQDCGKAALDLLSIDKCDRVLIIWDLYPSWQGKPCRKEDREAIFASLKDANVKKSQVDLICIAQELEAWLLADGRALSDVLSTATRPVRIRHRKHTERISNPKKMLNRIYQEHIGRRYNDLLHAAQIVRSLPNLDQIARIDSFQRFRSKLIDAI